MKSPLYMEVYKQLKHDIITGKIKPDEKLISDAELSQKFNVSAITLKRSMELLSKEGLILRRPGVGTVVQAIDNNYNMDEDNILEKKPTIALIITHFDDKFGSDIISGIVEACGNSCDIIIKKTLGDIDVESQIIIDLVESGVDGILLIPCTNEYISKEIMELACKNYPIVVIDRKFSDIPISCVCSDNIEGSKLLTKYLFDKGNNHIGLVGCRDYISTVGMRKKGFIEACASLNGLFKSDNIIDTVMSTVTNNKVGGYKEDIERIKKFINKNKEMTAIIAIEYNIALLCTEACKQLELDKEVVCFDHPKIFNGIQKYDYTHIRQDQTNIGIQAFKQVYKQIKNNGDILQLEIEPMLIIK